MLTILLATPILGVVGILLAGENSSIQKRIALTASLVILGLSLILCAICDSRERKIHAAYFFFLITLLGSLFMLLGILVLYFQVVTTDYQVLTIMDISISRQRILWLAFFLSFAVKTPLVPVHLWLPYAH